MADTAPSERFDLRALREKRALMMYPVVALGGALPFLAHAFDAYRTLDVLPAASVVPRSVSPSSA
ncbi:MAG: hypothetical protein KIT84_08555 [Labilithrix sp.]|nr:hypothetical protein [Labilithrix sp.]MCW5811049.1 hypothetical protein [Labilithrix sp.]